MGQVLHGSATTTEAIRRAIQHSQESLRALAKRYGINQKTVAKWKKRTLGRRSADRAEGPEVDGAVDRGGGDHRRLPAAYAAAARRLPLRPAADDSAPDTLVPASLPAASWHQPLAGCRRRQAGEEEVQDLPDRLLPHRHRRGADRRGQALSLRGHRSDQQVRLRAARQEDRPGHVGVSLPARPDRGRSLQNPHGPHRQRHPVHLPAAIRRWPDGALHDAHVRHALPRERHRAPHSPRSSIPGPTDRSNA